MSLCLICFKYKYVLSLVLEHLKWTWVLIILLLRRDVHCLFPSRSRRAAANYRASKRGIKVMPNVRDAGLKKTPRGRDLAEQLGKSLTTKFGTVEMPVNSSRADSTQPDKTLLNFFRVSHLSSNLLKRVFLLSETVNNFLYNKNKDTRYMKPLSVESWDTKCSCQLLCWDVTLIGRQRWSDKNEWNYFILLPLTFI